MVVYMRHILYIYSHFPCLKVFFKGRCSFLLLFLNLWGTWMTRILPRGIGDPHLVQSWWVVSRNQFIWNSLDDLPWFLVIYDDLPWFLVMKNPCFLMKKWQFLNTLEGRCFVVFVGGCFVRAKRRRGLSGAKKGANWLLFLKMDVLSSFLRKYSFIYIDIYLYLCVCLYEWYVYTNLHRYTCGDIVWCEWGKQFICLI